MNHDVKVVAGNHDRWLLEDRVRHIPHAHHRADFSQDELAFLNGLPRQLSIPSDFGQLQLCHGVADNDLQKVWPGTERLPAERSELLDQIIAEQEIRYVINGHMHYRTVIHFEQMTLINAGTLKADHRPGFALLDLATQTVTGFEFDSLPNPVKSIPTEAQSEYRVFQDTQAFAGDWQAVTLYA